MKLLVYTKPIASSLHYHSKKHESFYVASGEFEIQIGSGLMGVARAGAYIVLPPCTLHRVRCIAPGTIVEASTKDDPADCIRIVPSES